LVDYRPHHQHVVGGCANRSGIVYVDYGAIFHGPLEKFDRVEGAPRSGAKYLIYVAAAQRIANGVRVLLLADARFPRDRIGDYRFDYGRLGVLVYEATVSNQGVWMRPRFQAAVSQAEIVRRGGADRRHLDPYRGRLPR
jgi:hypothetical protein